MKRRILIIAAMCLCASAQGLAVVLTVDAGGAGDYTSIQAAIDDANDGDVIEVQPGIYRESINFLGKDITVTSLDPEQGLIIDATIIDANGLGSAVTFDHGEPNSAVLTGFTVTGGTGKFVVSAGPTELYWGGGICCEDSSPTIVRNVITGNHGPFAEDSNGPVVVSFGGGIVSMAGAPVITRNIIKQNSAWFGAGVMVVSGDAKVTSNLIYDNSATYGGGAAPMFGGHFLANTIVENSAQIGGGVCLLHDEVVGNGAVKGNIICDNTDGGGFYADPNNPWTVQLDERGYPAFPPAYIPEATWFNDISGNSPNDYFDTNDLTGLAGNITADPCFVNAAARDFRLHIDSACIDAGDPAYVLGPNETDFRGLTRIRNSTIDMGAIEYFNTPPVAVAGPNQSVTAGAGDLAEVTLDGSGSYDGEKDPLAYHWTWTVGPDVCEAEGVSPVIALPVGKYEITLVVDDGIELSEPGLCTVSVASMLAPTLSLAPSVVNSHGQGGWITARLDMPEGIAARDIDTAEPLVFYPGAVAAQDQRVLGTRSRICIMAFFDTSACRDNLSAGSNTVRIEGRLTGGQSFCATGEICLMDDKFGRGRFAPALQR